MGIINHGKVVLFGNFTTARRYKNGKPKNWMDRDYKAIVPYDFTWRTKLGKVECDCKEIIEAYQPFYGFTWFHSEDCACMKHLRRYPQMQNFMADYDPKVIAFS
jgi:hypothetical protein